jgi:HSP90 family molecular chaperone
MGARERQGPHLDAVSSTINSSALTTSEPKEVSEEEYKEFYKAVAKDPTAETLGWSHFKVCGRPSPPCHPHPLHSH